MKIVVLGFIQNLDKNTYFKEGLLKFVSGMINVLMSMGNCVEKLINLQTFTQNFFRIFAFNLDLIEKIGNLFLERAQYMPIFLGLTFELMNLYLFTYA